MNAMFRQALRKYNGLRQQLDNVLLGDNGDEWEKELKKFLTKRPCWIPEKKTKTSIEPKLVSSIDLDSPARLPFNGAVLEIHRGTGLVEFVRKADGVYLDGKKLGLFLSERQKSGEVIRGYNLRTELEARGNNVSAKVLDHFVDHPEDWPEEWKKDEKGNTIYVFFWNDIFRNPSNDNLCVRCGYWHEGKVLSDYDYLGNSWFSNLPAASSAS